MRISDGFDLPQVPFGDKAQEMLAHAYFRTEQFGKAAAICQKRTEMGLPTALHDEAE